MATLGNEWYLRHVLLLDEGGLLVLRGIVTRETALSGQPLEHILASKRSSFDNILREQNVVLFPSSSTVNQDVNTWDMSLLLLVIKRIFWSNLSPADQSFIGTLKTYRKNIQEHPTSLSMEGNDYKTNRVVVEDALRNLANSLGAHFQSKIEDIIQNSALGNIDNDSVLLRRKDLLEFDTTLKSLENNSTLSDINISLRDMTVSSKSDFRETKDKQERMLQIVSNMEKIHKRFMNDQTRRQKSKELETIVHANCSDKDKEKKAIEVLYSVVQIIQGGGPFSESEIKTIISQRIGWYGEVTLQLIEDVFTWFQEINDNPDTSLGKARIGSILLPIKCSSVEGLLKHIDYMNGSESQGRLFEISSKMSQQLGFLCTFSWSVVPKGVPDVLQALYKLAEPSKLVLPFKTTSVKGLQKIWKMFGGEEKKTHLLNISKTLSTIFKENILLSTAVEKDQFQTALLEMEFMKRDVGLTLSVSYGVKTELEIDAKKSTYTPVIPEIGSQHMSDTRSEKVDKAHKYTPVIARRKFPGYRQQWTLNRKPTRTSDLSQKPVDFERYRAGFRRELDCLSVPFACWPRIERSQSGIINLMKFCNNVLKEVGLNPTESFPLQTIDVYARPGIYNVEMLVQKKMEIIKQKNTEPITISESSTKMPTYIAEEGNFAGIFINHNGVHVIEKLEGSRMVLHQHKKGNQTREAKPLKLQIQDLVEQIIFEPFIATCVLFKRILYALHSASRIGCSEVERIDGLDENVMEKFKLQEDVIEDLFGEMIAMVNNSTLPDDAIKTLKEFRHPKKIDKEIIRKLSDHDDSVRGCGYRLNIFHVSLTNNETSKDAELRKDRIRAFLKRYDIHDIKFDTVSEQMENYHHVGAQINDCMDQTKTATLGCFAKLNKDGEESTCVLISKHLAIFCSSLAIRNDELFATTLRETLTEGGYDIAAAVINDQQLSLCNMRFKTIDKKDATAILYDLEKGTINLEGQTVYLWGAKSKPGFGTILMIQYFSEQQTTYIKVKDGSYAMDKPDVVFAEPGDSGAIVCMKEPDGNKIIVISMLMGKDMTNQAQKKHTYSTFPLREGVMHLSTRAKGSFQVLGVYP